jgi:hypothetical protein
MKNLIIGYGETLTHTVKIKSGSGPKHHPYSYDEARQRVSQQLNNIIGDIALKPEKQCAVGQVVIKMTQHPAYLAKTYYPRGLLNEFGLRDLGSRAVTITPDSWGKAKRTGEAIASCFYVAGKKDSFQQLLDYVNGHTHKQNLLNQLRTFETIALFPAKEKVKFIAPEAEIKRLEVVLHASQKDKKVLEDFLEYLKGLGGATQEHLIKCVGGLTFLPALLNAGLEEQLAEFSHLRALRSIPKLRVHKPDMIREAVTDTPVLPTDKALNEDITVCIFDGGIGNNHLLSTWLTEIVPDDVTNTHPKLLAHGSEVCATYLFGPYEGSPLPQPYTNVDLVRVLSPDDRDPDLFEVLTRIENVLKERRYKYINLSLGPRMPIDDDDVHVWTSVIDNYLQDGSALITVAAGNDGDQPGEFGRIQPPSDMVNCLAIGACNSNEQQWKRSGYSCIGPGRSPGIVKPDGVMFGGDCENLFKVYSPLTDTFIGTAGTSYSAPYALRVAAGIDAIAEFALTATSIKALLVHHAQQDDHHWHEVGWGRFPSSPEAAIECRDDEAIVIFQGQLKPSEHLRIPVPVPEQFDSLWVELRATFCINAVTDPEHPLHYTRSGLDISFRPNDRKSGEDANHASTKSFFSLKNLYETEQSLREDAHKWETCISRHTRFKKTTLKNPVFDVKYHTREQGGIAIEDVPPLTYTLVLSIRNKGMTELYNKVLQRHQTLQSIKSRSRLRIRP